MDLLLLLLGLALSVWRRFRWCHSGRRRQRHHQHRSIVIPPEAGCADVNSADLFETGEDFAKHKAQPSSSRTILIAENLLSTVGMLEKESSLQLESLHHRSYGHSVARGGQPILGRERSSVPGAQCLFLTLFLRLRGDHA